MKEKSFEDIVNRLKQYKIDEKFDMVAAIAHGGIVPGYLTAGHLKLPLEFIWINFRDENNAENKRAPELLKPINFEYSGKRILLVDDRSKTGSTLNFAKTVLEGAEYIKSFVFNGPADYTLFDEDCFIQPWNI